VAEFCNTCIRAGPTHGTELTAGQLPAALGRLSADARNLASTALK
jgi:hypothetical protein